MAEFNPWGYLSDLYDVDMENDNFGYDYPEGLDLRPRSTNDLHTLIKTRILRAADDSYAVMQERFPAWREIDQTMTGFIHTSDYEKNLKKRPDEDVASITKPISIVVPNSFAVEDTILTYLSQVFLVPPVFGYDGFGPEDEAAGKMLEVLVSQQVKATRAALDLHTAFKGGLRYGLAASTMRWLVRTGLKTRNVERQVWGIDGSLIRTTVDRETSEAILFEGSDLTNIDPYRMLPDPGVSAHRVRDGAFFGWTEIIDYETLLAEEQYDPELFNVQYLRMVPGRQNFSKYTMDLSDREMFYTGSSGSGIKTPSSTRKITIVNMYMTIIPYEWQLGKSKTPEVWFFRLADDKVVLTAQPLGLNHGQFPVAVNAPEFDGYSITPISRLEVVQGLQTMSDWMINSHVANVRKAINDMLIVDPSLVHMPDFKKPGAGRLIRLRREAWGRGVKEAVSQLVVTDITRQHIPDSAFANDMMQRATGAVDSMQGIMRSGGERRSATEAGASTQAAISRLEHVAFLTSIMYMQDLGMFYAEHTQQLMTQERQMRILGDWPEVLQKEYGRAVTIGPNDILIDYDLIVKDGSTATAGAVNGQFWIQLIQLALATPAVGTQLDIMRMFLHGARLAGYKNVQEFVIKGGNMSAEIKEDMEVQREVERGNLIATREAAEAKKAA